MRRAAAYERTIAERGCIPPIILDDDDKDAQEKRLRAELGHPEFVIAHVIVKPPPVIEPPYSQWDQPETRDVTPKAYVEDNVRRAEMQPSSAVSIGRSNAGIPKPIYDQAVRRLKNFQDGDDRADNDDFPLPPMRNSW